MNIKLLKCEEDMVLEDNTIETSLTDEQINQKYITGTSRIITEHGSMKINLINDLFSNSNYTLKPDYQRRIVWDSEKRSKLIESIIMNIPIPPIFIYETSFGKYQVMDGLQRINAIIDFYNGDYKLEGLSQWKELNGRKYDELPEQIKDGIDRRQISTVTLLKESAKTSVDEDNMKKMVFERLNTGGVKLVSQEIRNALYPGKFNDLCQNLSENKTFRKLWNMVDLNSLSEDEDIEEMEDSIDFKNIRNHKLYIRMDDVELILRFFAMRHINSYNIKLSEFLDLCLIHGNKFSDEDIAKLCKIFEDSINIAYSLFGKHAFCQFSKNKWSIPQKMIYDPMMLALSDSELLGKKLNTKKNIEYLKNAYVENEDLFNGKNQGKSDILKRAKFFKQIINDITGW